MKLSTTQSVAIAAVVVVILAAGPLYLPPFYVRVGQLMLYSAGLGLAWAILGGFAGYASFGHSAFIGVGAFTAGLVEAQMGSAPAPLLLAAGLVSAAAVCGILSALIAYPILRLRGTFFAIAMMGVCHVCAEVTNNVDFFQGSMGLNYPTIAPKAMDPANFNAQGTIMGSGGLIFMDERDCIVDMCKWLTAFDSKESCGRCTTCRIGSMRIVDILDRMTRGVATGEDLKVLQHLEGLMQNANCVHGQFTPKPFNAAYKWFKEEFEAHVFEHRCPSGTCRAFEVYTIDEAKATGAIAGDLVAVCPVGAIERSGDRDVVQYRGDIMPLVGLHELLGGPPCASAMRPVVVFQGEDRPVGLVAPQAFLDEVHEPRDHDDDDRAEQHREEQVHRRPGDDDQDPLPRRLRLERAVALLGQHVLAGLGVEGAQTMPARLQRAGQRVGDGGAHVLPALPDGEAAQVDPDRRVRHVAGGAVVVAQFQDQVALRLHRDFIARLAHLQHVDVDAEAERPALRQVAREGRVAAVHEGDVVRRELGAVDRVARGGARARELRLRGRREGGGERGGGSASAEQAHVVDLRLHDAANAIQFVLVNPSLFFLRLQHGYNGLQIILS